MTTRRVQAHEKPNERPRILRNQLGRAQSHLTEVIRPTSVAMCDCCCVRTIRKLDYRYASPAFHDYGYYPAMSLATIVVADSISLFKVCHFFTCHCSLLALPRFNFYCGAPRGMRRI